MIDLMGILFILIAWFVEMPLWLSIILTVLCGIRVIIILAVGIRKIIVNGEVSIFSL